MIRIPRSQVRQIDDWLQRSCAQACRRTPRGRIVFPEWFTPEQIRYLTGSLTLTVSGTPVPGAGLPIVPGAFGFGMETRAAYGGASSPTIFRVTKLTDDGSVGTLRYALDANVPRVVIFEVSGTITLNSDIFVTTPYLTIAGQTAPSPGITIKGFGIQFYTHDVLMQHVRVRPGDGPPLLPQTADHDAGLIYTDNAYNVVIANCSFSWAQGKNFDVLSIVSGGKVTLWHNIFSEALYRAANVTVSAGQPSSLGLLLANSYNDVSSFISCIGNLLAHNCDRNPEIQGPVNLHWLNNVIYDWGKDITSYPWATFLYWQSPGPTGAMQVAAIGNKYIAGPVSGPFGSYATPLYAFGAYNVLAATELYLSDNIRDQTHQTVTEYYQAGAVDPRVGSSPVDLTGLVIRSSSTVQADVLGWAGARPADPDSVDTRIKAEVAARTGNCIRSQNAVGGWPTLAINARALNPPASPHSVQASGYTNLEIWLQDMAASVE